MYFCLFVLLLNYWQLPYSSEKLLKNKNFILKYRYCNTWTLVYHGQHHVLPNSRNLLHWATSWLTCTEWFHPSGPSGSQIQWSDQSHLQSSPSAPLPSTSHTFVQSVRTGCSFNVSTDRFFFFFHSHFKHTLGHANIDVNSHGRLLSHFQATPGFHSTSALCTAPTEKVLSFPNLCKRKVTDAHPSDHAHTHTDIRLVNCWFSPTPLKIQEDCCWDEGGGCFKQHKARLWRC